MTRQLNRFVPAITQIRNNWRGLLVVTFLGVLATGPIATGGALTRPGPHDQPALGLPSIPSAGPSMIWTEGAVSPSATQAQAVSDLLIFLSALAWVGFGIAAFSIFSYRAAELPHRALETGVQRAVGASMRQIRSSLALELAIVAGASLAVGLTLSAALLGLGRTLWPGRFQALEPAVLVPALALGGTLLVAAWVFLGSIRARHLVALPDQTIGLRIPTFQAAVSVAMLMGATVLLTPSSSPTSTLHTRPSGVVLGVTPHLEDTAARARGYAAVLQVLDAGADTVEASLTSPGTAIGLGTWNQITTDCGPCPFGGILLRYPHVTALTQAVSPDSFHTLNIPVAEGRAFQITDSLGAAPVAVVNRQMAARYFLHGRAIGKDLFLGGTWTTTPYRVIGVVDDQRANTIGAALQPRETVYLSVLQHPPTNAELLVRPRSNRAPPPERIAATVHDRLGQPSSVRVVGTETEYRARQARAIRWFGMGFGVTAVSILIAALIGTLATTKRWADSMAWEIALRRALGARRRTVAAFVLRRMATIAGAGAVIGLCLYGQILTPALSGAIPQLPLGRLSLLIMVAVPPVALAVVAGVIPGFRLLWQPPGAVLRS